MKLTKDSLLKLVADLIEMVKDCGCDNDMIVETLLNYGFTKEQIAEWYGLDIGE